MARLVLVHLQEKPPIHKEVAKQVRKLWKDGAVRFPPHADDEMEEDRIDSLDIRHLIYYGRIKKVQQAEDESNRYVYEGKDVDGRRIRCVVEIEESEVVIVTAMRLGLKPVGRGKSRRRRS